jgi:hypothetical protein
MRGDSGGEVRWFPIWLLYDSEEEHGHEENHHRGRKRQREREGGVWNLAGEGLLFLLSPGD